jgi:hypothetical protein
MSGGVHVKYSLLLPFLNENLNFLFGFSKNSQISNFMKLSPLEAELFMWAKGQTDIHDQANSSFS